MKFFTSGFAAFAAAALFACGEMAAQSFTIHKKSGEIIEYSISEVDSLVFHEESAPEAPAAPRIGDFYYADGTWSTTLKSDATPIAIVFYVGEATDYGDHAAYYKQKDGSTPLADFHGYAVALNDATYFDGEQHTVWWSAYDAADEGLGCSTSTTDFLGYTNSRSIVTNATAKKGGLTGEDDNYPAAYYAIVAYEAACPAPEQSSGWFLPSAYQFKYIYDRAYFDDDNSGRACLANSFAALGESLATPLYNDDAEYWTSTEKVDSYGLSTWAYYFNFDKRAFKAGFIADYRKNSGMRVRSMLAF